MALDAVRPIDRTELVPLLEAPHRIAAREVRARIDVPLADRAAMDGYAVRANETAGASDERPVSLRLRELVYAGRAPTRRVARGTCSEVATGSLLPPSADAVVNVERTDRDGDVVRVRAAVSPGESVSPRGEDIVRGTTLVRPGDPLTPGKIGALAAVGTSGVRVFARPRVAVLTTGNEVVRPGAAIRRDQVYDVNSRTLAAVIRDHGGEPRIRGPVRDEIAALRETVRKASSASDLVVVSGGSSVGARDLLVDVLDEVLFHGVAIRPGRPTILGRVRGVVVLGMPGYPTSCLTIAYVFLGPMVRRIARRPPAVERTVDLPLAERLESPEGKVEIHPVRVERGLAVSSFKKSSAITSMADADGYIVIPADVRVVDAGARVRVILF